MKLNRGCGCLIFVLAAINIVFAIVEFASIFMDIDVEASKPRTTILVLWVGIFAANAAICILFGLRNLRRGDQDADAPVEEWTDDEPPA